MRFDEAFDALVEHCTKVAPALVGASGHSGASARMATYGNDIWIATVAQSNWAGRLPPGTNLSDEHYVPFYDAAWELCRVGVLRPGHHAPKGQGQIGGGIFSGDGYSITEFGAKWLADPERRTSADPSRIVGDICLILENLRHRFFPKGDRSHPMSPDKQLSGLMRHGRRGCGEHFAGGRDCKSEGRGEGLKSL